MKFTSNKHYYILFTIIATLLSVVLYYFLQSTNYPYNLIPDSQSFVKNSSKDFYIDLDNDGLNEHVRLAVSNNTGLGNNYINIFDSNGSLLEQLNFFGYSDPGWIYFEDYNNDNIKDIFAFSQLKDSLFISVFDYNKMEYVLNRKKIVTKPDSAIKSKWDIAIRIMGLKEDDKNKIIFFIKTGHSLYPRSVYLYDFIEKRIDKEFPTSSSFDIFDFFDLNNDGIKEIILTPFASGNTNEKKKYNDYTKYLFVLDQNLDTLFTPVHFGKYPGNAYSVPIKNKNGGFNVLFFHEENTDRGKVTKSKIIDLKGNVDSTNSILKKLPRNFSHPIVHNNNLYLVADQTTLMRINLSTGETIENEIMKKTERDIYYYKFIAAQNIFGESTSLLLSSVNSLLIVDENLNIQAKYTTDELVGFYSNGFSLKTSDKNKLPQLNIVTLNSNALFTIEQNKIHTYLPYIVILGFLLFFFLQVLFHNLLMAASTYIKYLSHSVNKTERGIAILRHNGNIFYKNNNFYRYLNLKNNKTKNLNYSRLLENNNSALKIFEKALTVKNKTEQSINISKDDYQFEGKISITPFTSWLGFTYAYLAEISDYTEPLLTDRGKVWGATLQRIAHEIKTPLSTLILSLDNLRYRLGSKSYEVNEEIIRMQDELERIKNLTKNFLLFANVEKTKPKEIFVADVVEITLNKFESYINRGIEINYKDNNYKIFADQNQVLHFFPLIIENAIDSCQGLGKININTEAVILEEKKYIKLTINDNGKGIPKEILDKIFEPYFTTKKDGTGMGLTLAKKIITDNNGKLEIKSIPEQGTDVIIYLPAA